MLAAGILAYVTRDHARAIAWFRRAAAAAPQQASIAYRFALTRARRLGWNADIRALLAEASAADPTLPFWRVQAERLFLDAGAWDLALVELREATRLAPQSPALWMERATVASRAPHEDRHTAPESNGRDGCTGTNANDASPPVSPPRHRADEVREAVDVAIRNARAAGKGLLAYRLQGADALLRVGELGVAEQILRDARSDRRDDPRPLLELGELALWRLDLEAATEMARRAADLAHRADGAVADAAYLAVRRLLGASELLEGDAERALDYLGAPDDGSDTQFGADDLGLGDDYRLHLWRGEALVQLDQRYEAHRALTAATMAADGFVPAAWALRLILALRDEVDLVPHRDGEVREFVRAVAATAGTVDAPAGGDAAAAADAILDACDVPAVSALLAETLRRSGGNRSTAPTVLVDGAPRRLRPITGERHTSRRALLHLRSGSWQESLTRLEAAVERYDGYALPDAHRGELLLWIGRTDEARDALERAIERGRWTRWAYIGLAGVALLEGDPERALRENERGLEVMGTIGPAVYAYRGEARLQLGRLDEAIDDLREAVRLSPTRLGSVVALAIALHRRGGDDDELRALHARLGTWAPALISDAAHECGVTVWERRGSPADAATMTTILEHALTMMRGNRSSSLFSYFTADGALRFVETPSDDRGRTRDAHANDHDDLVLARELLTRAAGLGSRKASLVPPSREH